MQLCAVLQPGLLLDKAAGDGQSGSLQEHACRAAVWSSMDRVSPASAAAREASQGARRRAGQDGARAPACSRAPSTSRRAPAMLPTRRSGLATSSSSCTCWSIQAEPCSPSFAAFAALLVAAGNYQCTKTDSECIAAPNSCTDSHIESEQTI